MAKKPKPCTQCGGEGVVHFPPDEDEFPNGGMDICSRCNGTGEEP